MERRDILEQARDRREFESNNLRGVDAEIAELERRLAYLKKEKRRAERRKTNRMYVLSGSRRLMRKSAREIAVSELKSASNLEHR